jgi:hypothetical protein
MKPELLTKCQAIYVPISQIGERKEVESLVIETNDLSYVIAFEEQWSDASGKIDMFVTTATADQIAFLSKDVSGFIIKKFYGSIISFENSSKIKILKDGDYEVEQRIIFRLQNDELVSLKHDASNIYPYSFHLES